MVYFPHFSEDETEIQGQEEVKPTFIRQVKHWGKTPHFSPHPWI